MQQSMKIARLVILLCGLLSALPAFGWGRRGVSVSVPTGKVQVNMAGGPATFPFVNLLKEAANGGDPTVGCGLAQNLDVNGYPTTGGPCQDLFFTLDIPPTTAYSGSYIIKQRYVTATNPNPSPGGAWRIQVNNAAVVSTGSSFTAGCTGGNCPSGFVISGTNPRVVLTWTNPPVSAGRGHVLLVFSTSTGTFTTPDIVICRSDQESLDDNTPANAVAINPDFILSVGHNPSSTVTLSTGLHVPNINPSSIRFMDMMNPNFGMLSIFGNEPPIAAISYNQLYYKPSIWAGGSGTAGTISSSGGLGVTYTAGHPDDWTSLSNGVMLQGHIADTSAGTIAASASANNGSGLIRLTVADNSTLSDGQVVSLAGGSAFDIGQYAVTKSCSGCGTTHVDLQNSFFAVDACPCTIYTATLNVGSTGPHIIANVNSVTGLVANKNGTFVYDSYGANGAGVWQYNPHAIQSWPFAAMVQVANAINVSPWFTINTWYNDASMSTMAAYVRDNLRPNLSARYEWANECWNESSFDCGNWAWQRGISFGFNPNLTNPQRDYLGLRSLQMYKFISAAYAVTGATNYIRIIPVQAGGCCGPFQDANNGVVLAPSGTSTGLGNSNYVSFTSTSDPSCPSAPNCNYTVFPNRPIDSADHLAYATYSNGAQIASPLNGVLWASGVTTGGPTGWTTGLKGAADACTCNGGNNDAGAFAFADWDIAQGTRNGVAGAQTLTAIKAQEQQWETQMANYDAARSGHVPAIPLLVAEAYEGSVSPDFTVQNSDGAGAATCATMGLDSSYCGPGGKIANFLIAYKSSSNFQALAKQSFDDFFSFSHSTGGADSWFEAFGTNISDIDAVWSARESGLYDPPVYTSWNAISAYNH